MDATTPLPQFRRFRLFAYRSRPVMQEKYDRHLAHNALRGQDRGRGRPATTKGGRAGDAATERDQPMRSLKRILIADDHALFRKGLKLLLSDSYPKADLRDVDSLDAALEALSTAAPVDLAILDLRMPGMAGVESLRAVREAYPETAIL